MRGAIPLGRPAIASRTAASMSVPFPASPALCFRCQPLLFSDASTSRERRANGMTRSQCRPRCRFDVLHELRCALQVSRERLADVSTRTVRSLLCLHPHRSGEKQAPR